MKHSWRQHPQRDRKKVRILCEASSTLKMSRTQRTFRWTEVRLDWFSSTTGFYEYRFWGSGLTFDHLLHVVFSLFSSGVWMHLLDLLFYIGGASSPSSLTSSFVPPCYTCVFIPPCLWCFCQTPDDSWQQTCCQTWLVFFFHICHLAGSRMLHEDIVSRRKRMKGWRSDEGWRCLLENHLSVTGKFLHWIWDLNGKHSLEQEEVTLR